MLLSCYIITYPMGLQLSFFMIQQRYQNMNPTSLQDSTLLLEQQKDWLSFIMWTMIWSLELSLCILRWLLLGSKGAEPLNFRHFSCLQDAVTAVGCLHPIKPLRQVCMANFRPRVTFFFFFYSPKFFPSYLKNNFLTPFSNNFPTFGF